VKDLRVNIPRSAALPGKPACLAALFACCALGPAAAEDVGGACQAALSAAQRERFSLTLARCESAGGARSEARGTGTAAPHSQHLELFNAGARRGTPTARIGTPTERGSGRTRGAVSPRAVNLAPALDAAARRHDIDPLLLHAIAHVESRHQPAAVSPAGARGLMQVMPTTGARFGIEVQAELHHTPTNLEVSAAYLKQLQRRFGSNLRLVLAAYNAGEGAVERHGRRVPPFAETERYVREVLDSYATLRAIAPLAAGGAAAEQRFQRVAASATF
jgi:lysozyme